MENQILPNSSVKAAARAPILNWSISAFQVFGELSEFIRESVIIKKYNSILLQI